ANEDLPFVRAFAAAPVLASGSTFDEVTNVLNDVGFAPENAEQAAELAVYRDGYLPLYPMSYKSVFGRDSSALKRDAVRTVTDKSDYYPRLDKLLHPNGVCVTGAWKITKASPYSGYFKPNTEALFLGRVSVAMEKTTSKHKRGFGFAGKIFPTTDRAQLVDTTNFFTVDVLMGTDAKRFLDVGVTNEPETGFSLGLIALGLKISKALKLADKSPMFRPISPIAKIGESPSHVRSPKWIRIRAANGTVKNDAADFRTEIVTAVRENKILKLAIDVSETTSDRKASAGWSEIGEIQIDKALVSYGCDRRIHFAHPKADD
ncbi:MAG: hypothetical protein AAB250_00785, partial [Bdellovibrionota bacterium]